MSAPPPFIPSPEQLALCGLTGDDFRTMFLDLLPQGWAWSKQPDSVIYLTFDGAAQEPARVAARDCDLLAESYPCQSEELLTDWERVLGLPDSCTTGDWTEAERQEFVCAKLAEQGGQSRAYYVALAARYGFHIRIIEHFPWRMGCTSFCIVKVGNSWFWWQVVVTGFLTPEQKALLECVIRRAAPAHTIVTFIFPTPKAVWNKGHWNKDAWN
jgi:uncharacterized protein YmfQ (DUF2313 family)